MRMDVDRVGMTLTDQNFQTTVLESPRPVLVAFTAEGCGPWQLLAPEIAALAKAFQDRVTFATLDVEAQPQTPSRYGIETSRPCCFLKMGRLWISSSGLRTRPTLPPGYTP